VRVSIGDCRLYVDVEGLGLVPDGATMRQRPTLLALHGGPGFDHTSFKPDFGTLADIAQIVYVDHRGQGRSDHCTPDTWHFAQWADDVVALCEALEIERPFVYGVSFGSMVAAHYGVRHPGHAAGLILDSTAAHADLPAIVAMFQRLGGDEAAQAAAEFWEAPDEATMARYFQVCMPLYNRRTRSDGEDAMARSLEHATFDVFTHWAFGEQRTFDLRPQLEQITSPTLVLAGTDDPITPASGAHAFVEALRPDVGSIDVFDDCGHGVWRDQPALAFAAIRRFLAR
jgi:pimeloyl-ACP methyl ester carboxylesterase